MRIKKVHYQKIELKLTSAYTIAYETVASAVNFILQIETDTHIVGYGCAAPDREVTNESPEDVELAINKYIIPFLFDKNPLMISKILEELTLQLPTKSSSLAMVDMALLDIASRKMNVPLYQFLGGYRSSIATSITIGILPVAETLKVAMDMVAQGFFILKVKGGISLDADIEKTKRLRERFPDVRLRFDANQGYTISDTLAFYQATKDLRIDMLEQPTKIGSGAQLGKLKDQIDIPIMADEGVKNMEDMYRLARNNYVNMINIKLMKVGGIAEGMHLNSIAKSAGISVMVGCIDECQLGIAAGLHFALSRPNIKYADLDGHLEMENDPFTNLFTLKNGVLYPSEIPGLGIL